MLVFQHLVIVNFLSYVLPFVYLLYVKIFKEEEEREREKAQLYITLAK